MNVELLVMAADEAAVNGSLFFVHTARRYLRWDMGRACGRGLWARLDKSRNMAGVGESVPGS
jgi:hypothetical protein